MPNEPKLNELCAEVSDLLNKLRISLHKVINLVQEEEGSSYQETKTLLDEAEN